MAAQNITTHQQARDRRLAVRPNHRAPSARVNPDAEDQRDSEHRLAESLHEGQTWYRGATQAGGVFETEYVSKSSGERLFSVVWLNKDFTGFLDESRSDRIIAYNP